MLSHRHGIDGTFCRPVLAFEHGLDDKRTLSLELGVFLGLTAATPDQAVKVKLTYGF